MLLTNSGNSAKDWSTNAKHWAPYRMHPDLTKRYECWANIFLKEYDMDRRSIAHANHKTRLLIS